MKISVVVKPHSKHTTGIEKQADGSYVLYARAPAIEGKANTEALRIIAREFNVSQSAVHLSSGVSSRHKLFEISDL